MSTIDNLDFVFGLLAFLSVVASWILYLVYQYRRNKSFKEKNFKESVQFSLTYVDSKTNTLRIRTLMELPGARVFHNQYALDKVTDAAAGTTLDDAFIKLGKSSDQDFMLVSALNALSSKYSDVFLREAITGDIESGSSRKFVFGVSNEKYDTMTFYKLRVMVMAEDLVQKFNDPAYVDSLNYEVPYHNIRARTMAQMAGHYAEDNGVCRGMYLGL
mmetsp:Transcript_3830/g.4404  ORF Transcript_3830/g.4404 Transcript_3830/m.4404 type:complete len:216 (+) Transcript_3830:261-908(+)|eukprot:CAMPEP_0184017036 /NCGR_PEP_ID=MMETSP0954-20121128/7280_1 /TAXON_ID=627963 /ORGANISM="Aplanochytrium sp, Strain PBS07" /LENGTH=215 /DNA_ID=CAMNT_0026298161 /DNA_START=142 /DNA_END=789 /DNA_ORIENTATION=+